MTTYLLPVSRLIIGRTLINTLTDDFYELSFYIGMLNCIKLILFCLFYLYKVDNEDLLCILYQ